MALPDRRLRRAHSPAAWPGEAPSVGNVLFAGEMKRQIAALPDKLEQVSRGQFDEARAQEDVVVDVVHSHGQRPQRKVSRIRRQVDDAQGLPADEHGCSLGHSRIAKGLIFTLTRRYRLNKAANSTR